MEVGLFFGSFNPIHVGHLIIANFIAYNTSIKEVWFIVTPQNPEKSQKALLNEYHRLHLVKIATENEIRLKVSDVEFKLPKPSYTINTLAYLKERYPNHKFNIIIGSDSLENLSNWKNAERIIAGNNFIVYERPGYAVKNTMVNINLVKAPLLDISSSKIRQFIKEEKSIRYMVTDKVFEEIINSNYYK